MCLIALAYKATPDFELLALANRDEFYARPAAPLHLWEPSSQHGPVVGGQDLQAGGTWMAVSRYDGVRRFAAVTNYRNPDQALAARSRGELVSDFLEGELNAADFAAGLGRTAMQYGGFNLLLQDDSGLHYCTNRWPRQGEPAGFQVHCRALEAGVYVLSNHLLDSPWPKSLRLRQQVDELLRGRSAGDALDSTAWLDLMLDRSQAADEALPLTGMPVEMERQLSSAFIALPGYGTRCSTLVSIGDSKAALMTVTERRFSQAGIEGETTLRL
ncbi:NRDE family protein [Allohahella marinimesophila]|uniref:NRDE family protein n=1 Tax=Allohahella marinimesophila TaxID=1054972 RepID=A0ABP7NIC6_9GAMM